MKSSTMLDLASIVISDSAQSAKQKEIKLTLSRGNSGLYWANILNSGSRLTDTAEAPITNESKLVRCRLYWWM